MKKVFTLLCAALLGASALHAVPAKRVWRTFTQPDGSKIELMQGGDEFVHYYITRDGDYVLNDHNDGYFKYATVDAAGELTTLSVTPSEKGRRSAQLRTVNRAEIESAIARRATLKRDLRAQAAEKRAAKAAPMKAIPQTGLGRFTSNYPRTGDVRCLVFLVEYTDVKFQVENPQDYYTRFCNAEKFTDYGATGSVGEYFREQSDNQFRPVYDVFGPVPLKYNRAYYGGNDSWGDDKNAEQMVVEAVEYYKDQIDFSQYDFDNDGYVDNVFILYAGQGEASYGPSTSVWPHSYNLQYTMTCPEYNGKLVDSYTCTNEWEQNNPDGIGTFCHEFSHTMGLPDLYDPKYVVTVTPGDWSVLDYGPYNNDGRTPPNYSIYERNAMGWMVPTVLDGPASIELDEITSNTGYLIETDKTNEFFLIENRQQTGWDTYVHGHGMLVWHIDFNQSVFDQNAVNSTKSHQYVDIVEANNNANAQNPTAEAGYPFPGTSVNTEFTATSKPAMKSWSGKAIDMPITNIREINGRIYFDVAGGYKEVDVPSGLKAEMVDDDVKLSWNAVEDATGYRVTAYYINDDKKVIQGAYDDYAIKGASSITLEGLAGRTEYFFFVKSVSGQFVSEPSETISFTTPKISISKITPTIYEWSSETTDEFTLRWNTLQDATEYLVTVHSVIPTGNGSEYCGFDSQKLPKGWSVEGREEYYTSTGNYGNAVPSFKLGVNTRRLNTPVYPGDIRTVSFWLKGQSSRNSYLSILGRASEEDSWTTIVERIDTSNYNDEPTTLTYQIPEGFCQLQFQYTKSSGNMAIDDIELSFAGEEKVVFNDYDRFSVGNTDSHTVVLNASRADEQQMFDAFIEAVDEDGTYSRPSEVVRVIAGGGTSGNSQLTVGENLAVVVNGNSISYSGTDGLVTLVNAAGITVASAQTVGGEASVIAPANGFFILTTPEGAVKIQITH